jgi:DNA-directed RNA polymerase subunit RPC12/RpoP
LKQGERKMDDYTDYRVCWCTKCNEEVMGERDCNGKDFHCTDCGALIAKGDVID